MPRLSTFSMKRPARHQETRDFSDPAQPGAVFTITLREADAIDLMNAGDLAKQIVTRYVTGDGRNPAFPFMVDGGPVTLTASFIARVCEIVTMQPPEEALGHEPYTFEELADLSFKMPRVWLELNGFWSDMWAAGEVSLPNEEGASSPASCEAPLTEEPATLRSGITLPMLSGVSASG